MSQHAVPIAVVSAGRELVSRVVRQELQALTPTLIVVAAGSFVGIDLTALLVLAGVTALVTVATFGLDIKVSAYAPRWLQVADRAGKAAAGTALGYWTADGISPATEIHWGPSVTAIAGSALLAAVMYFTNPPVVSRD